MKIAGEKLPQNQPTTFRGLDLIIEWPKGSTRVGKDKDGKPWAREMSADYGYVPDTTAAGDREDLDVYVGPDEDSDKVFVVEQLTDEGEFDEFKVLLGFDTEKEAFEIYLKHYPEGWEESNVGDVFEVKFDHLFDAVEKNQDKDEPAENIAKNNSRTSAWTNYVTACREVSAMLRVADFDRDESSFVHRALAELHPGVSFGDLPFAEQSKVLQRAQQLKEQANPNNGGRA